jgi:hypothetical protein
MPTRGKKKYHIIVEKVSPLRYNKKHSTASKRCQFQELLWNDRISMETVKEKAICLFKYAVRPAAGALTTPRTPIFPLGSVS